MTGEEAPEVGGAAYACWMAGWDHTSSGPTSFTAALPRCARPHESRLLSVRATFYLPLILSMAPDWEQPHSLPFGRYRGLTDWGPKRRCRTRRRRGAKPEHARLQGLYVCSNSKPTYIAKPRSPHPTPSTVSGSGSAPGHLRLRSDPAGSTPPTRNPLPTTLHAGPAAARCKNI